MEEWKLAFQVLQFLITCGIAFYVHLTNKDKVTNDRIGKLEAGIESKIDGHGERIAKLETQVDDSPTHDHLSEIHEKINQVGKDVSALAGEFTGVRNLLGTINSFLMGGGKS